MEQTTNNPENILDDPRTRRKLMLDAYVDEYTGSPLVTIFKDVVDGTDEILAIGEQHAGKAAMSVLTGAVAVTGVGFHVQPVSAAEAFANRPAATAERQQSVSDTAQNFSGQTRVFHDNQVVYESTQHQPLMAERQSTPQYSTEVIKMPEGLNLYRLYEENHPSGMSFSTYVIKTKELNRRSITDPNKVIADDEYVRVVAPKAETAEPAANDEFYNVRKGDNLWTIFKKHDLSLMQGLALPGNMRFRATPRLIHPHDKVQVEAATVSTPALVPKHTVTPPRAHASAPTSHTPQAAAPRKSEAMHPAPKHERYTPQQIAAAKAAGLMDIYKQANAEVDKFMPAPSDTSEAALRYMMGKGYTDFQAAGMVGNFAQESGVNPARRQTEGGNAEGIAMWEGVRLKNLKEFAASQGKDWKDLYLQLDNVERELNTNRPGARDAIKATTNVVDATIAFEKLFEGAGIPMMQNRIGAAQNALEKHQQIEHTARFMALVDTLKRVNQQKHDEAIKYREQHAAKHATANRASHPEVRQKAKPKLTEQEAKAIRFVAAWQEAQIKAFADALERNAQVNEARNAIAQAAMQDAGNPNHPTGSYLQRLRNEGAFGVPFNGEDCAAGTAAWARIADPEMPMSGTKAQQEYLDSSPKWQKIGHVSNYSQLLPGDIGYVNRGNGSGGNGHTWTVTNPYGDGNGHHGVAASGGDKWPRPVPGQLEDNRGPYFFYRFVGNQG